MAADVRDTAVRSDCNRYKGSRNFQKWPSEMYDRSIAL